MVNDLRTIYPKGVLRTMFIAGVTLESLLLPPEDSITSDRDMLFTYHTALWNRTELKTQPNCSMIEDEGEPALVYFLV